MRILLANTFHYPRGGASIYALRQEELLRSRGHELFPFAMRHPKSIPAPKTDEYWPSYIDYPALLAKKSPRNIARVLKRTIYSKEAAECLRRLIDKKGPFDVAHLHNIMHHLTPSILDPLRENGIPIVWTLHDFSLLCPNTNFINDRTGKLCTKCLKGGLRFINAPLSRCKKGSFAASSMAAIEAWNHRLRHIADKVDLFISPSEFLVKKFVEAGFDAAKFRVVRAFVDLPAEGPSSGGDYVLYAGRLSREKGLNILVSAWRNMPPDAILKIAGSGPIDAELREMASDIDNIEFLGFVEPSRLRRIRRDARFTVVPSVGWDNFPISAQESLADGVPVLGSRSGGIPEMVIPGKTGELFERGKIEGLFEKARRLWDDPELCRSMGIEAQRFARDNFAPEDHAKRLEEIYASLRQ